MHFNDAAWLPPPPFLDLISSPAREAFDGSIHSLLDPHFGDLDALAAQHDAWGMPAEASDGRMPDAPGASHADISDQGGGGAAGSGQGDAPPPKQPTRRRAPSQAQRDAHKRHRLRKRAQMKCMEEEVAAKQRQVAHLEAQRAALTERERVLSVAMQASVYHVAEVQRVMEMLSLTGAQRAAATAAAAAAAAAPPPPRSATSASDADASSFVALSSAASVARSSSGGRERSGSGGSSGEGDGDGSPDPGCCGEGGGEGVPSRAASGADAEASSRPKAAPGPAESAAAEPRGSARAPLQRVRHYVAADESEFWAALEAFAAAGASAAPPPVQQRLAALAADAPELCEMVRAYRAHARPLLRRGAGAEAQLQALSDAFLARLFSWTSAREVTQWQLHVINLETGAVGGVPPRGYWDGVARTLLHALPRRVLADLCASAELYGAKLAAVYGQRHRLAGELQAAAAQRSEHELHEDAFMAAKSACQDLLRQLDQLLVKEETIEASFGLVVVRQLRGADLAALFVHSYPWWPNVPAILGTVDAQRVAPAGA